MKHLLAKLLILGPFATLPLALTALPAHAESADTTPPEIGLVLPATFGINQLVGITVNVKDTETGLDGCHLFVNGVDAGRMTIFSGQASLSQVFTTPETRALQVRCQDMAGNQGLSPVTDMQALAPDVSAPGQLPLGFSSGMLVRLSCTPADVDDEHCHSVYYVGHDAKRHAFQSDDAFRSWYPTDAHVTKISLEALASLPLGTPISFKPGHSAVRFASQPTVYLVTPPLALHALANDTLALSALGPDWRSHVDVLSDAFWPNFTHGSDISNPADIPPTVVSSPEDEIVK